MKSRTSFFNTTVLKKDITRFAPVWALYAIGQALILLLMLDKGNGYLAANVLDMLQVMAPVNFVFAGISGLLLFGDLFVPRLCNALHAMPMRREGWFLTHTAAGLLFCLIPNGICCLLLCFLTGELFYTALLWLAVTVLTYLFFFGTMAFAAASAGNRLGAVAVYGLFHFLPWIVYGVIQGLYLPLMYGVSLASKPFQYLCPLTWLSNTAFVEYSREDGKVIFEGIVAGTWIYLGIAAVIGVALWGLGLLIYRRRQLESAGDFISFRPVAPVFLALYTLICGIFLWSVADLILGGGLRYFFLTVGILVGFFTGRMLLERTVKVFTKKSFLGVAVLGVILAVSMAATSLDVLGIVRYVPAVSDVAGVTLEDYRGHMGVYQWKDPADIEKITEIHRGAVGNRDVDGASVRVDMTYTMKDGRTIRREYRIQVDSPIGQELTRYLNSYQYYTGYEDWDAFADAVYWLFVTHLPEDGDYIRKEISKGDPAGGADVETILAALKEDFDAGTVWEGRTHDVSKDAFDINLETKNQGIYLNVTKEAVHTYPLLQALVAEEE